MVIITLNKKFKHKGYDGSARKPALRQDTGYMVEKTYHDIATYFGAINGSKGVSIYKNDHWKVAVNSCYLPSGQKAISLGQKRP